MMIQDNFYDILELPLDATAAQIKNAYRTLARKYHPDVKGMENGEKFKDLHEAYDVLSNPLTRATYDNSLRLIRNANYERDRFSTEQKVKEEQERVRKAAQERARQQEQERMDKEERARQEILNFKFSNSIKTASLGMSLDQSKKLVYSVSMPDYYEILDIDSRFSYVQILRILSFYENDLSKKMNPDSSNGKSDFFHDCYNKIVEAEKIFLDRDIYDKLLKVKKDIENGAYDNAEFNIFKSGLGTIVERYPDIERLCFGLMKDFTCRLMELEYAKGFEANVPNYYEIFHMPQDSIQEDMLDTVNFAKEVYQNRLEIEYNEKDEELLDKVNHAEVFLKNKEAYDFALQKESELKQRKYRDTDYRRFSEQLIKGGLTDEPKEMNVLRKKLNLIYCINSNYIEKNVSAIIGQWRIIDKAQELYLSGRIYSLEDLRIGKLNQLSNDRRSVFGIMQGNSLIDVYSVNNANTYVGQEDKDIRSLIYDEGGKNNNLQTVDLAYISKMKITDKRKRVKKALDEELHVKNTLGIFLGGSPYKYFINNEFPQYVFVDHKKEGLKVYKIDGGDQNIILSREEIDWQ